MTIVTWAVVGDITQPSLSFNITVQRNGWEQKISDICLSTLNTFAADPQNSHSHVPYYFVSVIYNTKSGWRFQHKDQPSHTYIKLNQKNYAAFPGTKHNFHKKNKKK